MASNIDPSAFDPAAYAGGVATPGLAALHGALATARDEITAIGEGGVSVPVPWAAAPAPLIGRYRDAVSVKDHAPGVGAGDAALDTPAIQAAIDYARGGLSYRSRRVLFPAGTYRVTASIDAGADPGRGASNHDLNLVLEGDGPRNSRIWGVLPGNHPILDLSGGAKARVRGLSVTDNNDAASHASCAVLLAPTAEAGGIGEHLLEDCFFAVSQTRADAVAGVAVMMSDMTRWRQVRMSGPYGLLVCNDWPEGLGITSAYRALVATGWDIDYGLDECYVSGRLGSILFHATGTLRVTGGYLAVEGAGPTGPVKAVIHRTLYGQPGGIILDGVQVEDQSTADPATVALIESTANFHNLRVIGGRMDVEGPILRLAAGAGIGSIEIDTHGSYGAPPIFDGGGTIGPGTVKVNRAVLGAVADGSGPIVFGATGGIATDALPAMPWIKAENGHGSLSPAWEVGYGDANADRHGRMRTTVRAEWAGGGLHPGDGSEQLVITDTISHRLWQPRGHNTVPGVRWRRIGGQQWNGPAGGRLRVELVQGGTVIRNILDWTGMPAAIDGRMMEIAVELYNVNWAGEHFTALATARFGNEVHNGMFGYLAIDKSVDLTVKVYLTATGDRMFDTNVNMVEAL